MEFTAVGVDVAKRVLQLHWVEPKTGEIRSTPRRSARALPGSKAADLQHPEVQRGSFGTSRRPLPEDPQQIPLELQ
ncbi:hypothetical protein QFZ91_000390 [Paraburkholderia sp. JPY419]